MNQTSVTIEGQALNQAYHLGIRDGKADLNATGMVEIVDIVDQCVLAGQWLDTLANDPHAFNNAHSSLRDEYVRGYGDGKAYATRLAGMRQAWADKDFERLNSYFGGGGG